MHGVDRGLGTGGDEVVGTMYRLPAEFGYPADPNQDDHSHDHGRIVVTGRVEKRAMTAETTGTSGPRTIKASEFKAKCLKLMDEVAESGEEIVITKNGRPVSRLVPFRERPASLFGIDRDLIVIHGDITEPIDVEWEAQSDPDRVLNP